MHANPSPASIFRAATNALGSNSRNWSTFILRRSELESLLHGYAPRAVSQAVQADRLSKESLRPFFPGITNRADAAAVLKWADRLSTRDFNAEVRQLAEALRERHQSLTGQPLPQDHLMPCLVAFLGAPPSRWPAAGPLGDSYARTDWKLPGMAATLGSEFFRNLGWSGFKPDRHVMRLLDRWVPEVVAASAAPAGILAQLVGRSDRATRAFLTYSLAGQTVTPAGTAFSVVDNLVWALGAYVERKGRESGRQYVGCGRGLGR